MTSSDHLKLQKAGFTIIRANHHPSLRIKYKGGTSVGWVTLEKDFKSEAALRRRISELLKDSKTVQD